MKVDAHSFAKSLLPTEHEHAGPLGALLGRFFEVGYDPILEDWANGLSRVAPGGGFNLIPSEKRGPCREILVAICSKRGRTAGRPRALKRTLPEVFESLDTCVGTTRIVILVTPTWNWKEEIEPHAREFAKHCDRGVVFLGLYSDCEELGLSPIVLSA